MSAKKNKKKKSTKPQISITTLMIVVAIVSVAIWGASEFYTSYQQKNIAKQSEKSGVYKGVSGLHYAKLDQNNYSFRESKMVLDPMRYRGQKQIFSYGIAKQIPQVLDQIYCFCGCSHSIGHRSLLSCFTDDHAANCGICMDQAILADKMIKNGSSITEIVDEMDARYN